MTEEFNALSTDTMDGVTELPDGGAIVELDLDEEGSDTSDEGHYDNLAEYLSSYELNALASDLLELIEKDKEAREERDKQQEEGIRRTGLGDDAPGGATFDGAASVVHPAMAEGCVDFSARAIKELFPSNGPVRTKIIGEAGPDSLEKARRKRDFLNYYLIEKMPEYRAEKEILLTQLPLGGSQYEKYWFDGQRVRMEFVPVDKVFLPYSANSFYTANRITHEKNIIKETIDDLVASGFYSDVFGLSSNEVEESSSEKATSKVEGKTASGENEDGTRTIYEVTCNRAIGEDETVAPYVVHIDEHSGKVCAVYRNWRESDESRERLDWWVENKFIPWRGAYGVGFPHLIGGLAGALTGSLRALLDSAHINNAPTAIKLKGGRASGQNVNVDITGVTEIEAPAGTDDIRKVIMPMPFNPPSSVLFQLMDWLTNQAKGVVATAEERIADAGSNMPVGTALALIEQGSQVFSSIHARLHESQRRALKIICRLIADYPEHIMADLGRFNLVPADFLSSDDIAPVSDPNIFSESQRFAQMQAVMQLATADVQDPSVPWNKLALRRRMLETLRVEGIDELLPKPPEPITADPVSENVAIMRGQVVQADIVQDHQAHIKAHLMFILQPIIAQGSAMVGPALAKMMDHVHEHILLDYQHVSQAAQLYVKQQAMMTGAPIDPDNLALQAAMLAQDRTSQNAQALLPLLNEANQVIQAKTPQPPVDPGVQATKDVAMAQLQQQAKRDQDNITLDKYKFDAEHGLKQQELAAAPMIEQMKREFDAKLELERMMREDDRQRFDAMIELQKNEADNRQHQMTELMKNRDDNETDIRKTLMEIHGKLSETPQPVQQESSFEPMFKEMQTMLSQIKEAKTNESLDALMRGMDTMMSHMNAPTELIKDPVTGKTVGARKVQSIQAVQTGE